MAVPTSVVGVVLAGLALAGLVNADLVERDENAFRRDYYPPPPSTVTITETCTVIQTEPGAVTTRTVTQIDTVTDSASACVCTTTTEISVSVSTTTSSITATTATTPSASPTSCPIPPSCNNLGFDWAYYNNSAHNGDKTYSTFHPNSYKKTKPIYISTTNYVGGLYGQTGKEKNPIGSIYDSPNNLNLDYFALNHHAYLYDCQEGTYHISIPYANDAVYLWTGRKAYIGWTDANADAKALYDQPDHIAGHASYELRIPANTYVPIRFFYGQAQYGGGFTFNVTTPDGEVLVSSEAKSSPYVVRYSCDEVTAPKFPRFGNE